MTYSALIPREGAPASACGDAVVTHNLSKCFDGHTVVDSLELRIPTGCVYGFLGPNGSGKSTTMKMILGLLLPTSGEVHLFGQRADERTRARLMPRIGSMIETPPGYGHLTGMENMRIVQRMLRLSDQQINDALALVGLSAYKDRLQRQYSLGMKQRLGIAIALARQPQLLVLDEPTNGLDPAGIEEIRELLIHLAAEGVTVMVSSHLLDEVDKMASVIGILSEGKLVFQGSREKLLSRSLPDVIISTPQAARAHALGFPGRATARGLVVPGCRDEDVARLIVELVRADIPIYEVSRAPQRLEDVFMDLTALNGGLR